jgi:hypothetical protein
VSAQTPAFRKHALCPKPEGVRRTTLPCTPHDLDLERLLGDLAPDERKALDWIVENADLIQVEEDAPPFLLVQVSPDLLDTLAAFGAEAEGRENDLEDEPTEDVEQDMSDDEPSLGQEGAVVDGEPEWSLAPTGALKSAEAFRARGITAQPRRRARVEVKKLRVFLEHVGKDGGEVRRGVLTHDAAAMSADIVKLPGPKMQANTALCARVVGTCGGDEAKLFETALLSLLTVYGRRGADGLTRRDLRGLVNRLSIAWLALGEILGIPSGEAEEHLPDNIA